jgi:hypothetical protein
MIHGLFQVFLERHFQFMEGRFLSWPYPESVIFFGSVHNAHIAKAIIRTGMRQLFFEKMSPGQGLCGIFFIRGGIVSPGFQAAC